MSIEPQKQDPGVLMAAMHALGLAVPPSLFHVKRGYSKGQFLRSRERVIWPAHRGPYRRGMQHDAE